MSKIQQIKIENLKAITDLSINFKGCTAIVIGGNNKGKSTFLRSIPDRIRFIRPEVMVKEGQKKGSGELILDTGEKFLWEFDVDGKDKLTYITSKGAKQSVTKDLGSQFFPPMFDIDKFLQSPPKKQSEQLQAIVGIDFTDIDKRYAEAYAARTDANRDAEKYHVKLTAMLKVEKVDAVDLTELQTKKEAERERLNKLYLQNKQTNADTRKVWEDAKKEIDAEVKLFNDNQVSIRHKYNDCFDALAKLKANGYTGNEVQEYLTEIKDSMLPEKVASALYPIEPTWIEEMPDDAELKKIDDLILDASDTNTKANEYQLYIKQKEISENAQQVADDADALVKSIEAEREALIASAKMPAGISITPEGITVDGFPLDRNQISTSKLYTSALRIASMNLGEVKTLYFDASFLDRNSLEEIEQWAAENNLQLLIERPDYDGGEISYQLVETI